MEMSSFLKEGLKIEPVFEQDAERLSEVARRAYSDHYLYLWSDGGAWYIERCFSAANLRQELADRKNRFYLAVYKGEPVGFLKTRPANSLEMFGGQNAFEVERIYLTKEAQGKGIGQALMEFSFEQARALEKDLVWLKVMDSSSAAIAFYKKLGFEKCGTQTLEFAVMREKYRGMFVLRKMI